MLIKGIERFSPGRTILFSVITAILIGSLLLSLPCTHKGSIPFIDICFVATSATCVTGLLTVPLDQFTPIGHLIILCLIQIGGLGLLTLTLFFVSMFMQLGYGAQILAGQLLELESWKNIRSLLFFIFKVTIFCQLCGALCVFLSLLSRPYGIIKKIFISLFHAVSCFCNAGFDIFPEPLATLQDNIPFLIISSILMVIGGIGFLLIREVLQNIRAWYEERRFHLSLSAKIALGLSFFLIVMSTLVYFILERTHAFKEFSGINGFLQALFTAISSKSTGLLTFDVRILHPATLFLMLLITFIGSSPGSTGSGVKTTTVSVFFAAICAAVAGRSKVEIKSRQIPQDQVYKALAIISLALFWICIVTFILLIVEPSWSFFEIFFEVFSSFATLGLSIGNTATLSSWGKIIIMISMIVGRIGPLTMLLALKKRQEPHEFQYPEERIMLG